MPMLRTFYPETHYGVIAITESQHHDRVVIEIDGPEDTKATVIMTQEQFTALCRLGVPSPYDHNADQVRFTPVPPVEQPE